MYTYHLNTPSLNQVIENDQLGEQLIQCVQERDKLIKGSEPEYCPSQEGNCECGVRFLNYHGMSIKVP